MHTQCNAKQVHTAVSATTTATTSMARHSCTHRWRAAARHINWRHPQPHTMSKARRRQASAGDINGYSSTEDINGRPNTEPPQQPPWHFSGGSPWSAAPHRGARQAAPRRGWPPALPRKGAGRRCENNRHIVCVCGFHEATLPSFHAMTRGAAHARTRAQGARTQTHAGSTQGARTHAHARAPIDAHTRAIARTD